MRKSKAISILAVQYTLAKNTIIASNCWSEHETFALSGEEGKNHRNCKKHRKNCKRSPVSSVKEFRFSIISVSHATSLQDCLCLCQNGKQLSKWSNMVLLSKLLTKSKLSYILILNIFQKNKKCSHKNQNCQVRAIRFFFLKSSFFMFSCQWGHSLVTTTLVLRPWVPATGL